MLDFQKLKEFAKKEGLQNYSFSATEDENFKLTVTYNYNNFSFDFPFRVILFVVVLFFSPILISCFYLSNRKYETRFGSCIKREVLTGIYDLFGYGCHNFDIRIIIDDQWWHIKKYPFATYYRKGASYREGEKHKEALEKILKLKHHLIEKEIDSYKKEKGEEEVKGENSLYQKLAKEESSLSLQTEENLLEKILAKHSDVSDKTKEEIILQVKEMIKSSKNLEKLKDYQNNQKQVI